MARKRVRAAIEYGLFYKGKFIGEGNVKELAVIAEISLSTLNAYKSNKHPNSFLYEFVEIPDETEFALYYGDDFIDIGTKKELMEMYNIEAREWGFYTSPTAKKRAENRKNVTNGIVIERIEDDEFY